MSAGRGVLQLDREADKNQVDIAECAACMMRQSNGRRSCVHDSGAGRIKKKCVSWAMGMAEIANILDACDRDASPLGMATALPQATSSCRVVNAASTSTLHITWGKDPT